MTLSSPRALFHADLSRSVMPRLFTVGGTLYHGRKDSDTCMSGDVRVEDPDPP